MAFALVGTTITQTGTDTDLTGLSAIVGVTTTTWANTVKYDLGDNGLVVDGTLSFDSEKESLFFSNCQNNRQLNINGTFQMGAETTVSGFTRYSTGTGLEFGRIFGNWYDNFDGSKATMYVSSGGTLIWYGSHVNIRSQGLYFAAGSTITIRQGSVWGDRVGTDLPATTGYLMVLFSTNMDIDGWKLVGSLNLNPRAQLAPSIQKNISVEQVSVGLSFDTDASIISFIDYEDTDVAVKGNVLDYVLISGAAAPDAGIMKARITNSKLGTEGVYSTAEQFTARNRGILEHNQTVKFICSDTTGALVDAAKIYIAYTDDGNRVDTTLFGGPDYTALSFLSIVADGIGEASTTLVTGALIDIVSGSTTPPLMYTSLSSDDTDDYEAFGYRYGYGIVSFPFIAKGVGQKDYALTYITDISITEALKATVDAYPITVTLAAGTLTVTGDAATLQTLTAAQFYDAVAAYMDDTFAGVDIRVSREGLTIDGAALDIVLDYITYTGNITTTGAITLSNGSTISGLIDVAAGQNNVVTISNLTASNVQIINASNTVLDRQTAVTGTYTFSTAIGVTGAHKIIINRLGYAARVIDLTFAGAAYSFVGTLTQTTTPSGVAMYQGTSSGILSIVPTLDGSSARAEIGNGTVGAQAIYDESEVAFMTEDGMSYLGNGGGAVTLATLPTGTFLFLQDNYQLKRALVGDSSATGEFFATSTQGTVLDNTNGDVQFVTVTRAQQLTEYDGFIWVDLIGGVNENQYPAGTPSRPVNSVANAKTLADFYGLNKIKISGASFALAQPLVGYALEANTSTNASALLLPVLIATTSNGLNNCTIEGFGVTGAFDVATPIDGNIFNDCILANLAGVTGLVKNSKLSGTLQVEQDVDFVGCYGTVTISPSGAGASVSVPTFSGAITIANMTSAGATISVGVIAGTVTIAASCTAGIIVVANADQVIGTGSGVTVIVVNDSGSAPTVEQIRTEMDTNSTKLDVAVSTRMATFAYVAPDNATIALIQAKTTNLPASPAAVGSAMNLAANAVSETSIATGAITSAKFAAGAITSTVAPNLDGTISSRAASTDMLLVKAKTDLLTFTGTDVRATLDGELVTTDSASRTASQATGFATPANVTDARDAILTQGNTAWATSTGFSTFNPATDTVKANVEQVTGVVIVGSGTESDPWRPDV